MRGQELRQLVQQKLTAMGGSPTDEEVNSVCRCFYSTKQMPSGEVKPTTPKLDDIGIRSILEYAIYDYDGNTKTPPLSWWHKRVAHQSRSSRVGSYSYDYQEPTEEERAVVAEWARKMSVKFGGVGGDNKTAVAEKIRRFRNYVTAKLVRVETRDSSDFQQWISRDVAMQRGLAFLDPQEWLNKRKQVIA